MYLYIFQNNPHTFMERYLQVHGNSLLFGIQNFLIIKNFRLHLRCTCVFNENTRQMIAVQRDGKNWNFS